MIYQYVCKFYLNASHYIYIKNKKGEPHSHCFELVVDIGTKDKTSFVSFTKIEKSIETILQPYQEKLLNEVSPFDDINPTLENIAGYFEVEFIKELTNKGWVLLTLEVSETPTRSYLINVVEDICMNKRLEKMKNKGRINNTPLERVEVYNKEREELMGNERVDVGFDTDTAIETTNVAEVVAPKKDIALRRKVVEVKRRNRKQKTFEVLDSVTGLHYTVAKKLNIKEDAFDYDIPEELMHYDYEEPIRKSSRF